MTISENISESLKSIKANFLRSILTALIIAIGISALVGILTSIDAIQSSVDDNLANLGARSFEIERKYEEGKRKRKFGRREAGVRSISYQDALDFQTKMNDKGTVALWLWVSGQAELKAGRKKTNNNSALKGINENYLAFKGYNIIKGRAITQTELSLGVPVAVIGQEIAKVLFDDKEAIGQYVYSSWGRFLVIGILEDKGSGRGDNSTVRQCLIPMKLARFRASADYNTSVNIGVLSKSVKQMDEDMAMAEALMRQVRSDRPGTPSSFRLTRSESLAASMKDITGYLRIAGFVIGFVTLLGASIGLMNIMMVSVTERTREIGVRKALGATQIKIRMQFLIEAIVICQIGGIAGIGLGILIGNLVASSLDISQFIVPWFWMGVAAVVCFVVGVLSGYYPAWKASQLDPIESLRYE